ncbi:hypothetical protein V8G54_036816, partial [Vigna mungo]
MWRGDAESVVEGKERGNIESKLMMMVQALNLLLMLLMGFPSVDLAQQVLLSFLEELICELPSIRHNLSETLFQNNVRPSWLMRSMKKCNIFKLGLNQNQVYSRESYISIELANKAREVVVFEVVGEKVSGKLWGPPNNEGSVV